MKHKEYELQKSVCRYLRLQYPNVLFLSDTVASVKLTTIQGVRNKAIQKEGFKTPDLIILEPKNGYAGLMIELKLESPFYKGQYVELKKNEHIEQQSMFLGRLNDRGYFSCFAWNLNMAISIIDDYFKPINADVPIIEPHTENFYKYYDR